ncbi:MAG: methionyl-tRNA formyltransferase [Acidobacteriota bacterium]|nr:methionyl-tRNA formyltransferase [Acidobacteriota bacterium]
MKVVFCGTPQFAVPCLQALLAAGHKVALVVTQPDRAAGRGMELQAPPVKRLAMEHHLPVVQPEKIRHNQELRAQLEAIAPDVIVVVAYGRLIPDWMLALPRFGNINVHGSLLPRYRGAAPIQWAVANGETTTGVTTMLLDAGLDTGDILLERSVEVGPQETSAELYPRLAEAGASLLLDTLAGLADGTLTPRPQDHALATHAPILTREDGAMLFTRTAGQLYDRWRGFQPWPGAHTVLRGKKLIVHRMQVAEGSSTLAPGTLLVEGGTIRVVCGMGSLLQLDEVQLEGKKRMPADEFLRGFQLRSGERLGA